MAESDVANLGGIDFRARDRIADHGGGQIDGGGVLEGTAKGADGGAYAGQDDDFTGGHCTLLND